METDPTATSDKILLSNTKLYDTSLDLSSPTPEISSTYPPPPRPLTYGFNDIPLYRTLQALAQPSEGRADDWWITFYDLVGKVWAVCAGMCEYAVGRGRVGQISLDHNEDEGTRLLDEGVDGIAGEGDSDEVALRGRLMMRQLYHNSHHLQLRLKEVEIGTGGLTSSQARALTGQWVVSKDDLQFWTELARRWDTGRSEGQ